MKLFITIATVLFLSACSQSQSHLSKKNIISHIENHELPDYLEVHSLKYKHSESGSGNERVSVSGLLKLKESLYQEVEQKSFLTNYIDEAGLVEKLPKKSESGFKIYLSVVYNELSKKTLLNQKYEAGLKLRFSGDLVFNENGDGDGYKDQSSHLSYQPLNAKVKDDFNDPVVDIDNFIDSTMLSLTTDKIDCASKPEKESIRRRLSLLKEAIITETKIMQGLVPEADLPDLLIDVTQVGLSNGLDFKKIVPQKVTKVGKIKSREISIQAEGKLEGIITFFDHFSSLSHPLGITMLNISRTNTETYKLNLILYVRLNDGLSVTNTDIGLVPFSRCAELMYESFENMEAIAEERTNSQNNYYLFSGFNELLTDLSGSIEIDSLTGNLRNPKELRLTGKYYGAGNIKYITDRIEGFLLKKYSIQAIGDYKEGRNNFSIDITLNKKED